MGFIQNVRFIMESAQANGENYVYLDDLATELVTRFNEADIKPVMGRKGEVSKTAAEVLATKLEKIAEAAPELGIEFPWTIVNYRFRAEAGLDDMEPRVIREVPLKNTDGTPKLNARDNKPAVQRYYMPVLAWVNPGIKRATKAAADAVPQLTADLAGIATVTQEGMRIILDFSPLATEKATDITRAAA